MKTIGLIAIAMALAPAFAFAIDGQTLINQSTVMSAGGFPYKITQPGAYKLTGNLTAPAGVNGIEISASNVTLDLGGFNITGPGQSCSTCDILWGIIVPGAQRAVTIRNGTITGFGGQLYTILVTRGLFEDLIFSQGIGTTTGTPNIGTRSVVRHVLSDGPLSLNCPLVAVENVSTGFLLQGAGGCVLANNLGPVF